MYAFVCGRNQYYDSGGCLCIMPLYVAETIITIGIKKAYNCTEVNSHSTVH